MFVSGSFFQLPDSKKKKNYHCLIFVTSPSSEVFKFGKVEERIQTLIVELCLKNYKTNTISALLIVTQYH